MSTRPPGLYYVAMGGERESDIRTVLRAHGLEGTVHVPAAGLSKGVRVAITGDARVR